MKATLTLVLLMISLTTFAQKAFEFEYYFGKTKNFEIKLSLANGYVLGSEVMKTDLKTGKKTKYLPNNLTEGKLQSITFLPDSADRSITPRKRNNITLYRMKNDFEILPGTINGTYGIDLKTFTFKLHKQKITH
ncbi:MAG: hypothetical protein EOO86_20040 [Pedobacter sp.]|nr:MAG: hypothetical protein EOO86_20040 [Pedobacter sp.]